MNFPSVKTEILSQIDSYIAGTDANYSKEVDLISSKFDYNNEQKPHDGSILVTNSVTITILSIEDIDSDVWDLIAIWLTDEYLINTEYVYPEITDYTTDNPETNTNQHKIKLDISYWVDRT